MIPALFGDDEHTGADGSYSRMLKARKWLYVASAFAVFHAYGLIDLLSFQKLLGGLISIPAWLLTNALIGALFYLIFQYILLLVQLAGSYRAVIINRLPDSDRTTNARMGIRNTEAHVARALMDLEEADAYGANKGDIIQQLGTYETQLGEYQKELKNSLAADATARPLFRVPEYAIDSLRALVPPIISILALHRLLTTLPGH